MKVVLLKKARTEKSAQTAVEYMLLLTLVAIIVFFGFRFMLPRSQVISESFFNKISNAIMDEAPDEFAPLAYPMARSGCVSTLTFPEDGFATSNYCPSYDSSRPFLGGRAHWGAPFNVTQHACCSSNPAIAISGADVVTVVCADEMTCGAMACPDDHPILVGRVHISGASYYLCSQAQIVTITADQCAWEGPYTEGDGTLRRCPASRPFMRGRNYTSATNEVSYLCCSYRYEP